MTNPLPRRVDLDFAPLLARMRRDRAAAKKAAKKKALKK
jgi:hypothetical protein